MQEIPILEALKTYGTNFNAKDMLPLPTDTPYGNLTLTYLQIVTRVECLNKSIHTLYSGFYTHQKLIEIRGGWSNADEMFMHKFEIEQIIYWLRKIADDFISIMFITLHYKKHREYPNQIIVASIGNFLKLKDKSEYGLENNTKLLDTLNDISNAYKHTLLNAQMHNHVGSDEPVVFALSAFNKAFVQPKFHSFSLNYILKNYNIFLADVKSFLSVEYISK